MIADVTIPSFWVGFICGFGATILFVLILAFVLSRVSNPPMGPD